MRNKQDKYQFFLGRRLFVSWLPATVLLASIWSLTSIASPTDEATTEQTNIKTFYEALFDHLERDYLHRKDYEWPSLREQTVLRALDAENFSASIALTPSLFDSIKCNHCQIFMGDNFYGSTLNKSLSQDDFSNEFLLEYQEKPMFSVKLLNGKYGYINIPGMLLIDLSIEELSVKTQEMYDQIVKLSKSNSIEGWFIDLRFNIGGNAYPMITALHHLLGDRVVYKVKDNDGTVLSEQRLKKGQFFTDDILRTKADISLPADTTTPVAIIIGKLTASAGENVAVAFKHRDNVIYIGEESYGHLTGNDLVDLPQGGQFAITTGYIVDEDGEYRPTIKPDIKVSKQDNFEHLILDGNVATGIEFINSNHGK